MGSVQVPQLDAPEERDQVVLARPLVPLVGSFTHLVTRRVGEPAREVLPDPDTLGIREENTAILVRKGRGPLRVGLFCSGPVEAYPPTAGRGLPDGAGLVSAVLAFSGLRPFPIAALRHRVMVAWGAGRR
jgi:hypothetical protein